MKFKEKMQSKLKKNGGFTLIEMLAVVAIIAILVVVSIPVVSNSLDKAKESTDSANLRAAKATAVIEMLNDKLTSGKTYYYDIDNGEVVTDVPTGDNAKGQSSANKDKVIAITIGADNQVTAAWTSTGG